MILFNIILMRVRENITLEHENEYKMEEELSNG